MKIGLLDIDCHAAKKKWGATIYPNLALCKISAWHKSKGDDVEWAIPFVHYDILYRSKIFNFSQDDLTIYDCDKEVRGGTGYDIESKLPQEIDDMQPDFSIYPNVPKDTSYGFLTRGCPNKCKWCVVPKKEGAIVPYWDVDRVANGNKKIVLMDNNILAAGEYGMDQLRKIIDRGYRVDFNQALDARLVTEENAKLLAQIKWLDNNRIRFGCDTRGQIKECERAMSLINANGFKGQYFLYTMLNDDFDECYNRVMYWWNKEQMRRAGEVDARPTYPYAQPYRDPYGKNAHPYGREKWKGGATTEQYSQPSNSTSIPLWQKDMERWCNKKQLFVGCKFDNYEPRKGFKCKQYFNTIQQ